MPRKRKLPEGMYQRGRHYYADFYAGGRRIRKKLATDLDAAKDILIELRSRAQRADFDLLDNDYPLDKLKGEWLAHCRQVLKPATIARYERALKRILPALAVARVSQVTVPAVLAFRQERLGGGACPRTVNLDVGALKTMLKWAVDPARLIGSSPLDGLKDLRQDRFREGRALTCDEVERLLKVSPQHWRDVWYALLVTGMRRGELSRLTFDDIDWEARELIVRSDSAKNHTERRIPIDDGLADILQRLQAERKDRRPGLRCAHAVRAQVAARFTRDRIFVTSQNTPLDNPSGLYEVFLRWCRHADIPTRTLDSQGREIDHVDLHSLRRTFATDLIVNGADPKSVQVLLGHKTLAMTMNIYAKVHGATKRQTVARLSYGRGTTPPTGVLEMPPPVQNGHQSVTTPQEATTALA
jgi:integrase